MSSSFLLTVVNKKFKLIEGVYTYNEPNPINNCNIYFDHKKEFNSYIPLIIDKGKFVSFIKKYKSKMMYDNLGYLLVNYTNKIHVPFINPVPKKEILYKQKYDGRLCFMKGYVVGDYFFYNYPEVNKCFYINTETNIVSYIKYPERTGDFSWFLHFDKISRSFYMIKHKISGEKEIYTYNIKSGNMQFVSKTNEYIYEIVGNKIHALRENSKEMYHYLFPLIIKNKPIIDVLPEVIID
jgi:hypothetical protein